VDYEGMRFRTGTTLHETVPTQSMRDGNFNGLADITDVNGTPFPGNVIPKDKFNRVAPIILQFYPLPNQGDPNILQYNNHIVNVANPIFSDQFDIRIDHTTIRSRTSSAAGVISGATKLIRPACSFPGKPTSFGSIRWCWPTVTLSRRIW